MSSQEIKDNKIVVKSSETFVTSESKPQWDFWHRMKHLNGKKWNTRKRIGNSFWQALRVQIKGTKGKIPTFAVYVQGAVIISLD